MTKLPAGSVREWNSDKGFSHPDRRVDDNYTIQTANRAAARGQAFSREAEQDVGAMEIRYDAMMARLHDTGTITGEPLVPHWVAEEGANNPAHMAEVENMIGQVFEDHADLPSRLKPEMIQTYRDAVAAASRGQRW